MPIKGLQQVLTLVPYKGRTKTHAHLTSDSQDSIAHLLLHIEMTGILVKIFSKVW